MDEDDQLVNSEVIENLKKLGSSVGRHASMREMYDTAVKLTLKQWKKDAQ